MNGVCPSLKYSELRCVMEGVRQKHELIKIATKSIVMVGLQYNEEHSRTNLSAHSSYTRAPV